MKKAFATGHDHKPDVDKAKRVYRSALEAIRQLDQISKEKKAYRNVFLPNAVGLRNKLKEYCEKLMFYNPADYGRKAEEVLWRKVFYDIIQVVKHNRKHIRPHGSLETAYRSHLAAATGYYRHLLFRLQQDFSLKLSGFVDFHMVTDKETGAISRRHTGSNNVMTKKVPPSVQEWAQRACHRCLICLGDIARYQQDFDSDLSAATAARYYYQALVLFPDIGMPHNQLGTLSGSHYYSCEAAYHYIRCMSSEKSFEGAFGNLKRLFEKNLKRYQDLEQYAARDFSPEQQRTHDIRRFLIRFLYLLDLFFETSRRTDINEVSSCCQATLHDFNLCMFYEPVTSADGDDGDDVELQYLDDDIVFKVVVICIATVYLLQRQCSHQVSAAMAFLLALFSHIVNHMVVRLQGALYEKENPNKLLQTSCTLAANNATNENDASSSSTDGEDDRPEADQRNGVKAQGKEKDGRDDDKESKKSTHGRLRNMRRRRRRQHSDSSEGSDLSSENDLSEGNEDLDDGEVFSDGSEDDLVTFFDESDSDSDALTENHDPPSGFSESVEQRPTKTRAPGHCQMNNNSKFAAQGSNPVNGSGWNEGSSSENLASLSSELFSTSMMFLGQDLSFNLQNSSQFENDIAEFENAKDIIQARKDVPVPPGFSSSSEAKHVAEITRKLVNFDIETDTETVWGCTDTEHSGVTENEADDDQSSSSNADKLELDQLRLQRLISVVQEEGLMPTAKLMCDWMKCHPSIISTCAQSSQALWCRMSVLLNSFPYEKELAQHDQCWSDELTNVILESRKLDWNQMFPLREDINLCHFPPLAHVHSTISFQPMYRAKLTDTQETFLRICCLRQFGHFLVADGSLDFTFDEAQEMFFGPSQTYEERQEKVAQDRMRDAETRRNQLMRDMAQLRLQAEVSQLEGSLQVDQCVFPPYVIPTTDALCTSMALVRDLANSARGIVVITLSVIDSLDFMKKETSGAREAIRWLENEFRKGNRFIRAQKSNETLPGSHARQLKKKNREMWCTLEILNCARYLAQQSGTFSSGCMVAVLADKPINPDTAPPDVNQALTLSAQEGVSYQNIADFANRWSDVYKNKG
ncbi:protein SMG5-like [Gigantopelta aegis]|uniref:protein SMG5-like n=1 Tax=Gigantopelta aegis TaxID=1735272 RepID=UPI001B887B99|nr:protein SMG5-like [Gigantopelta aegis]